MITIEEIKQRYTIAKDGDIIHLFKYDNPNEYLTDIYKLDEGIYATYKEAPCHSIDALANNVNLKLAEIKIIKTLNQIVKKNRKL